MKQEIISHSLFKTQIEISENIEGRVIEFKVDLLNNYTSFKNCTFKEGVTFGLNNNKDIEIIDCTFEKGFKLFNTKRDVKLKNNNVKGELYISKDTRNLIIEKGSYDEIIIQSGEGVNYSPPNFVLNNAKCDSLKFEGKEFNRILEFDNSQIETVIIATEEINHDTLRIIGGTKIASFFYINNHFSIPYVFDIESSEIVHFAFQSCSFLHRLEFANGKIGELYLHKVTFNEQTIFSEHFVVNTFRFNSVKSDYEISINYNPHICTLNIDNCDLNLSFWISDEEKRDLENRIRIEINGTFNGNVHIENIPANIHLACINSGTIFLNNIYSKKIIFQYFFNYNKLILNNFKLDKDYNVLVISESNLNETEFLNFDFDKFDEVVISRSNVSNMLLTNTIFPKEIQIESTDSYLGYTVDFDDNIGKNVYFKDSYRQLKNVMEKHKNRHAALIYKSKEMYYQKKELKFGFNWFTLCLNQVSNNHGISWQKGVAFTIILSTVFFILYNFSLISPFFCWDTLLLNRNLVFDKYIEFLASFPKLSIVKQETTLSTIVIILSKVFISYGIYQTIVAFRKYGK